MSTIITYKIHEVIPYINWIYFFHAWGFQPRFVSIANLKCCPACKTSWVSSFKEEERAKASEAVKLFNDAEELLKLLDKEYEAKTIFRLCPANSDGDDLILNDIRIPLLRQQTQKKENDPFLCLSDFIRPLSKGKSTNKKDIADTVGVFAATIDTKMEKLYNDDPYKSLLVQTLSDRLAEAATEKMHEFVRKITWGYAKDENLSIEDLLIEKFQGIRPAVGYPSLPDQSIIFQLDHLLNMRQIGITLTENGAMKPHASVCGLMFAHPAAQYFSIGKIGEDQLIEYANRKGQNIEIMRKFLNANLSL